MADNFDEFISILENANSNFEGELTQTVNKLGIKLYNKAVRRTPVRKNTKKIRGGTLRKNWKIKNNAKFEVRVWNNTEYGIYVEYPHRTRGGKGIVEGRYMLKRSFTEVEAVAEKEFKDMLDNLLKG